MSWESVTASAAEGFYLPSPFSMCLEIRLPLASRLIMLSTVSSFLPCALTHTLSVPSCLSYFVASSIFRMWLNPPHPDQQLSRPRSVWAGFESLCFVVRMHVIEAWGEGCMVFEGLWGTWIAADKKILIISRKIRWISLGWSCLPLQKIIETKLIFFAAVDRVGKFCSLAFACLWPQNLQASMNLHSVNISLAVFSWRIKETCL